MSRQHMQKHSHMVRFVEESSLKPMVLLNFIIDSVVVGGMIFRTKGRSFFAYGAI